MARAPPMRKSARHPSRGLSATQEWICQAGPNKNGQQQHQTAADNHMHIVSTFLGAADDFTYHIDGVSNRVNYIGLVTALFKCVQPCKIQRL